jgi:hypothetical protein
LSTNLTQLGCEKILENLTDIFYNAHAANLSAQSLQHLYI